jgi:uncharacterized membrane protein
MKINLHQAHIRLLKTLALSSGVSLGLLIVRFFASNTARYDFLPWNLFLAWLPLVFAWVLSRRLANHSKLDATSLIMAVLWLGFLPNAFYLVSDLIHAYPTGEVSQLFDIVMLVSFAWNGFVLGFISLFMMHRQLRRRLNKTQAYWLIAVVLLLCSYAIYLGRYLRWNSWDILLNPFGVVFDVSNAFISPRLYPQAFTTTLTFFVLLFSIYAVVYELMVFAKSTSPEK